ncbi:GFA family protein [Yoonia sp. SS1-5]|uniref:GFA family protein n=1 Tax=Yoonia rhodophyticola TaxID=3137370 RepID=A0AAN0MDV1_9RHOB
MSQTQFAAACHCGAVQFEVSLSEGLGSARRCTCSFCRMRGAVAVTAPLDGIRFLQGEKHLALYQFGTKTAKHYFCPTCGIYTHHQRRSNPNEYGVNVACLDGVSPFDFLEVLVHNGVQHPADDPTAPQDAGVLWFAPNSRLAGDQG